MALTQLCPDRITHQPHEWYEKWILRRDCPGLTVGFCGQPGTHAGHWYGDRGLCPGTGLAGRCVHGVQMLNHCGPCTDNPDPAVADVLELRRRGE
jgi:hypothetical protein